MKSIFVTHCSITPSMTFLHQIVFQDIKQNHWTVKYRSLTYIYFMRSIFVIHWSIIPSMTFIQQIVFNILGKINQPWNIGHTDFHLKTQKPMSFGWLISDIIPLERVSIEEPEDHWSCTAHLSAEKLWKSAVIKEKKFKNIIIWVIWTKINKWPWPVVLTNFHVLI